MTIPRWLALALGACALATLAAQVQAQTQTQTQTLAQAQSGKPAIVYLVRHAEKAGGPDPDPELTAQGQARARHLASILRSTGIAAIYSTATRRTRQTAQPLAQQLGVDVHTYDPALPAKLVAKVRASPATALVVGHSNTVPELVQLFGGKSGPAIDDLEFDRLYQLIIGTDGGVTTVLLHSVAP